MGGSPADRYQLNAPLSHPLVLYKEKIFDISKISSSATVASLKIRVSAVCEVSATRQRLVFSGKPLRPDSKTLESFHITSNSCIHLFPLPEATLTHDVAPVASSLTVVSQPTPTNRLHGPSYMELLGSFSSNNHTPMHFDPDIRLSCSEVRGWCYLLFFMSGMTFMDHISLIIFKGYFGENTLDIVVRTTEVCLSVGGLFVSYLGLRSVESLEPGIIKKVNQFLLS